MGTDKRHIKLQLKIKIFDSKVTYILQLHANKYLFKDISVNF